MNRWRLTRQAHDRLAWPIFALAVRRLKRRSIAWRLFCVLFLQCEIPYAEAQTQPIPNSTQSASAAEPAPEEPDGYRMDNFRAPVPATLKGAIALDTNGAQKLWADKAARFIDVLPQAPRPANLPEATVWRQKPRFDIPGSLWLPDTGYGALAEQTAAYFERGLLKAARGDRAAPLVFYCLANCWMSWNAAKRAINLGFSQVYWYRDGTDGWALSGYALEERQPEARP